MEPERCAECGFDATRLTVGDAITTLRTLGPRWRRLFKDVPHEVLRKRPDQKVWSPLEYAAHTRDVIAMNGWGMAKTLDGEGPDVPGVAPDEDAPDHGHNALDPGAVLDELEANARRMADKAEGVVGAEPWSRTAKIGGKPVDAGWALRHAVHDATHHLRDVERGLKQLGA